MALGTHSLYSQAQQTRARRRSRPGNWRRVKIWDALEVMLRLRVLLVAGSMVLFPVLYSMASGHGVPDVTGPDYHIDQSARGTEFVEVTVKPGDTLWKIADTYWGQGDLRVVIERIREINRLKSLQIYPGQVLKVPRS
mgnify:CR=1 FL=1